MNQSMILSSGTEICQYHHIIGTAIGKRQTSNVKPTVLIDCFKKDIRVRQRVTLNDSE